MSNLNAGNQNLTFAFKHKAKGLEFNRLMHQTIVPGVSLLGSFELLFG